MINNLFRKQFVLTKNANKNNAPSFDDWKERDIGEFILYTHPDLDVTYSKNEGLEVLVLGFLLDWENPDFNDFQILNNLLSHSNNKIEFIERTFDLFGQFVIIIKDHDEITIFNDALGTKSIFYKTDFSAIASTPKLLSHFMNLTIDNSKEAIEFYSHKKFLNRNKTYYIGDSTQYEDVKTLLANNAVLIRSNSILRYFPNIKLEGIKTSMAASEINKRLDGHTKALVNRFDCEMFVTAGLDSRILIPFGIKYNIPFVNYYKLEEGEKFYDTAVPKNMLNDYKIDLEAISWDISEEVDEQQTDLIRKSMDFPRASKIDKTYIFNCLGERKGKMLIFGYGGEIGRNYLGDFRLPLSSTDMAQIAGYRDLPYARKIYQDWFEKAHPLIKKYNYSLVENFYWEQRFGIWGSKGVAERNVAADYYAFFNNRKIFELMLSIPIKDRNPVGINLFRKMISQLDRNLLNYPINPTMKNKLKNFRFQIGIENFYNELKFRTRKYRSK